MNKKILFRQEVLNTKKNQFYGSVLMNTPIHYTVLTIGITVIITLIILFLIFAEFSEKFIVTGYLNSTRGIIRIFPHKNGIIRQSYVTPGAQIHQGEKLFLIDTSTDETSSNKPSALLVQLQKRKQLIEQTIRYKKNHLEALQPLLIKKYISLATYNEQRDQLTVLEHDKAIIETDIINYHKERTYLIRAPIDGIIASVLSQEGQYTNLTKPLVKVLPLDADLVAELMVPVKQAGFLQQGHLVMIRYDAYPYQRFGSERAVITDISHSILTDDEEDKPQPLHQPYYKVTAKLERQFITLYGEQKKMQHGMTLSAVIIGSKRKLWRWILDPIYSFYGAW